MARDTSKGYDIVRYDFHGDLLPDELASSYDTGTITCNTGLSGLLAGKASILRLDNSNEGNNEMAEVSLGHCYWYPANGHIWMEARFAIKDVSVVAVNVGFNDETAQAENSLPVEFSGTAWTSNATDWIGVLFDASDSTYFDWFGFWVQDGADTSTAIATLDSGITPVDEDIYTVRIDVFDAGSGNQCRARFHITDEDGRNWEKTFTSTIDRDQALVPHIGIELRSAADNGYMDIDYIEAGQSRCSS